jgi:hypothetical protein
VALLELKDSLLARSNIGEEFTDADTGIPIVQIPGAGLTTPSSQAHLSFHGAKA